MTDVSDYQDVPLKHLFDLNELGDVYDKKIVNLGAGAPGPDLLRECAKNFATATAHRIQYELENNAYIFQYGPAVGAISIRKTFAKFLSRKYQDKVTSTSLVVTSGATHGLHLILSTLIAMNGVIIVDEVTYMIALEAMQQFTGMKIITVAFDSKSGVDLKDLEQVVQEHKFTHTDGKPFWGLYYTIPSYHNPTGVKFSPALNKELVKLARKYDVLIACDDVYNVLCYDNDKPPKRLFSYDCRSDSDYKGNVVSNGTFSKILSPGARVGWLECPPRIVPFFRNSGILKSGGCANNYTSGIVSSLIELGLFDAQLEIYYDRYKERMITACGILDRYLPKACKYHRPTGGYFIWIEFPKQVDCKPFNFWCRERYKVFAIPGERFSIKGEAKNCIRLTTAFHEKNTIQTAVKSFCDAAEYYLKNEIKLS